MALARASKSWDGFRSILCPVDFSEQSRLALRYAQTIAARSGAALTVVYANDPLLIGAAAAALHDLEVATRSLIELDAFVDATLDTASHRSPRVKTKVSTGSPPDEILRAASRGHSDLIVLGSHGLTGSDRLFIGSTTLSILQRTSVPVLAVPRAGDIADAAPAPSWPGERIVAPLELDATSSVDVEIVARIAGWFGSSLLLFHVISAIAAPAWLKGDLSAHDRIRVAQAEEHLDALAATARRLVRTETRVICGRAADEIAALAAAERATLIVSALRDRRGWFGARRGSISYHVLSHAVAPVLAYPPGWRPR